MNISDMTKQFAEYWKRVPQTPEWCGMCLWTEAKKYKAQLGKASNELFTRFFARISGEMCGVILAELLALKVLQAQNFRRFLPLPIQTAA